MRRQNGIYEKTQELSFSLCDYTQRCKLSTLLSITSDMAGEDYGNRGLPHDKLISEGYVFLVSRVRFKLKRNIRAEERIKLITYERRIAGPFCIRDYIIEAEDGEEVITGRSAWILCDPASRRILRPTCFPYEIQNHEDITLPVGEPEKLKLPENMQRLGERLVVYSDLDGNGHVNNSVYADMACDALPMSLFEGEITDFAINFVKEAKAGDAVALFGAEQDGIHYVAGYVGEALCFECALTFA